MRADLTYCDFLILAPLQLEISAIESALRAAGWTIATAQTNEFPQVIEATIIDSGAAYFQRHIVVVQLNHQGVLNASVDTARVLELYEPGYVISFGIAGTLNKTDAPLGAVTFATSLIYYEPSKDRANITQSRMDLVTVGNDLLNPFRNLRLAGITTVDGPIASGEKLIADVNSGDRNRIFAANDKTLAVEMEAAGVGRAVNRLCPNAAFVVIKGISDLADKNKNRVIQETQAMNRAAAAANAACCLVQLLQTAPLRRTFRGIPRPSEADMAQTAMREAKQLSDILESHGIRANYSQLYACLYGRRSPIPAYFHWEQFTAALHWIDFKILTALRALPKEIVSPIPFVTIEADDVRDDQPWYSSVHQLLGIYAKTERQIRAELDQVSQYVNSVGFTYTAQQRVRSELENMRHTGRPEITLNLMHYMLGQFCHRRMFVFTWKSYRAKWEQLTQAFGTWFTIFEWDTLNLGGKLGKQEAPGKDLLIEPGAHASLHGWLNTAPAPEVVQEFVDHFKCHQALCPQSTDDAPLAPIAQLKALMQCWDRVFFGLT